MIPIPPDIYPPLCTDQIVLDLAPNANTRKPRNAIIIVYKNIGAVPCQAWARPLPAFVDKGGHELPVEDTRNCSNMWHEKVPARTCELGPKGGFAPRVTIAPGGTASVKVEWNDKDLTGSRCLKVYAIRITPFRHDGGPDLPMRADVCGRPGRLIWSYTGVLTLDQ